MSEEPGSKEAGFTVIELLLVVGMLGLVVTAIYSTYLANQKNAAAQGEVVELQQNLRVALDYLTRDIKMAGMLVPLTATPIAVATGTPPFPTYSTNIMINTASADGRLARLDLPGNSLTVSGDPSQLELRIEEPGRDGAPNSVDGFARGDILRLLRPMDAGQPLSGTLTLMVSDIADNPKRGTFATTPVTHPSITVGKSDGSTFVNGDELHSSDILVKVADTSSYPVTVAYYLVPSGTTIKGFTCPERQMCLVRRVNNTADLSDIIATNISSLRFSYLDDSYHESSVPFDLATVRGVRINIEGVTARTVAFAGGQKLRGVTTVVKIRNRR